MSHMDKSHIAKNYEMKQYLGALLLSSAVFAPHVIQPN